jgi:hypothetical protein
MRAEGAQSHRGGGGKNGPWLGPIDCTDECRVLARGARRSLPFDAGKPGGRACAQCMKRAGRGARAPGSTAAARLLQSKAPPGRRIGHANGAWVCVCTQAARRLARRQSVLCHLCGAAAQAKREPPCAGGCIRCLLQRAQRARAPTKNPAQPWAVDTPARAAWGEKPGPSSGSGPRAAFAARRRPSSAAPQRASGLSSAAASAASSPLTYAPWTVAAHGLLVASPAQ